MSKKDDSPAISLFSFQDIITSITGIMFLVVLLLLLLIFESTPTKTPPKRSEAEQQEIQRMIDEMKQIQQEIQKFKDFKKQLAEQLKEYQKMPPSKIEERKQELEELLRQITEKNIKLKTDIAVAKQQASKDIEDMKHIEKSLERIEKDIEKTDKENKENTKKIDDLKKKIETTKKTVGFSVEQNSDKKTLLAEFGKDGFMVLDFASNKVYDLRMSGSDDEARVKKFLEWVADFSSSNYSVSVIVGPSKLKFWDMISDGLRKKGFSHGLELHPKDDMSIFSSVAGGGK